MSWSLYAPDVPSDSDAAKRVIRSARIESEARGSVYNDDQFKAAVKAVCDIVSSGSVGDKTKTFHVSLTGHANPMHEPKPGYGNDMITISISQVRR